MPRYLLFALLMSALAGACAQPARVTPAEPASTVTIMSFNVENLFDNADDPQKNDETFLALGDKQSDEHRALCAPIPVDR